MLHVVLYKPEIPPNTGNIARQCVGMNACLHIIGPISMDLSSSAVKRAGLDYWDRLDLTFHVDSKSFLEWLENRKPWLVSKHGEMRYDRADYSDEDVLIFGNEITGLPDEWISRWMERTVYVPMTDKIRSYNLANTAGIVLAQACLRAGILDKL